MKNIWIIAITSVCFIASCNKEISSKEDDSCGSNSGALTITHDGLVREYLLYIPTSYNSSNATPLVMNFHGFGGLASEYMDYADMRSLADAENFILVYPQGTCLNGSSHWNTSLLGGDNKSTADDFGFVEAMLSQISLEYNVDSERIYACGYSNGGMFAYGLANYKSELVAGVASVSGTMLDFDGPTTHPMPVIHLHGTSDGVIPYNGSSDYSSAQAVLDHWINFNNTVTSPTVNSETGSGLTIEHYLYDSGDSSVSVEHYKYVGGDHVWFTNTYSSQNAGQLIWNFLSKYDINGLM
ncbi:MAG: hypothetical protein MK078_03890 [Crocinitomicaceae bacterium]|nr:hypothetical protein [Crocinitomicaceae bacterium]